MRWNLGLWLAILALALLYWALYLRPRSFLGREFYLRSFLT